MGIRSVLVVVLALVLGSVAALGTSMWLASGGGMRGETVAVVVAAMDVPRFTSLTANHVTTRNYPRDLVSSTALTRIEDALDRVVASPLIKDEPILDSKLATKGAGRGMAAVIPDGLRAFTVRTHNVASGVAGFILPGNKVDVLLTINAGGADDESGGGSTTTLLQAIEILAVDHQMAAPAENKTDPNQLRSVTLLVTPDQAAKLDLGQNRGTLTLSLRNPQDNGPTNPRIATLADLRAHRGKPWDERVKGLMEAIAKAMPKKSAEEKPVVQEANYAAPPNEPPAITIRTLRGLVPGSVELK